MSTCTCSDCLRSRLSLVSSLWRVAVAWLVVMSALALYGWALGRGFGKW